MNGTTEPKSVVTTLPSGTTIRVAVTGESDGITSVGVGERMAFADALDTVHELAEAIREKLDVVLPTKATIEFGVGFTVEAGKLTSLLVGGRGEASLTITLEWNR